MIMKKVFIVHGFGGSPDRNWFPWLAKELGKYEVDTSILSMPTPSRPIKEEWVEAIKKNVDIPNENIFLIGHSLGVPAILRYLESLSSDSKIGGVVLVSGFVNSIPDLTGRYNLINKFVEDSFDFNHIKNVCRKFVVVHGADDDIVPFNYAEELSSKLSCELISVSNGGHLNDKVGFVELPQALDSLLKLIK